MLRRKRKDQNKSPGKPAKKENRSVLSSNSKEKVRSEKRDPRTRRDKIKIDLLIHDLKVPLAVIDAGIISLLKRPEKYGEITEKQQKVLTRVLRNTKTIQNLVNDTLELGRSNEGIFHLTNIRLSSLINQAMLEMFDFTDCSASENIRSCEGLAQIKEILQSREILLSIDEELWCQEISLDVGKTTQILRNLLNNALKYRRKQVGLELHMEDDCLILVVEDDGEGIPSSYHEKIFESYFQMDAAAVNTVRGHGLGLAGVMVLVEDMGGKLSLESDEGEGARFEVTIPLNSYK